MNLQYAYPTGQKAKIHSLFAINGWEMQCKSLPTGRKKNFGENYFGNKSNNLKRPSYITCYVGRLFLPQSKPVPREDRGIGTKITYYTGHIHGIWKQGAIQKGCAQSVYTAQLCAF
jgi:hypothetical protein